MKARQTSVVPALPALGRLRQENCCETNLNKMARAPLTTKTKQTKTKKKKPKLNNTLQKRLRPWFGEDKLRLQGGKCDLF